ncbi:unnamed protein product [Effrenium voratum]|nr:unnamed protein product [Effrenium voratum]CAJ1443320.1 unnamed protein product [Effrenium voratum]|mmetsp:Transcript_112801/g.268746  ORF Transcript_112801/g.268746 Transcript_112801/m.268746 type:complete len:117 (+) Transcript_112801:57-407(+)
MAETHNVIASLEVGEVKMLAVVQNTFVTLVPLPGATLAESKSMPDLSRWSKPWEGLSMLELHQLGRCRPCLFHTRKEDGCRKGDACQHCHHCSQEQCHRRRNRLTQERRKRARAGQ